MCHNGRCTARWRTAAKVDTLKTVYFHSGMLLRAGECEPVTALGLEWRVTARGGLVMQVMICVIVMSTLHNRRVVLSTSELAVVAIERTENWVGPFCRCLLGICSNNIDRFILPLPRVHLKRP